VILQIEHAYLHRKVVNVLHDVGCGYRRLGTEQHGIYVYLLEHSIEQVVFVLCQAGLNAVQTGHYSVKVLE